MSGSAVGFAKQKKIQKKRKTAFWMVLFLMVFLMILVCSIMSYNYVIKNHNTNVEEEVVKINPEDGIEVDIPIGSNTEDIAGILKSSGIIKHPFIFKLMSKISGYDGTYKSGTHIVSKNLEYEDLMRILSSNPVSVRVTIPEGYTYKQILDALSKKNLVSKDKFIQAINDSKYDFNFIKSIPKRDNLLEGYLFPDTYEFDLKAGETEIIRRMLSRFDQIFKPEYEDRIEELNKELKLTGNNKMTADKIVILASIIEREAKDPDDRARISQVFYNRLKSKDKTLRRLQSCATIQYVYLTRSDDSSEDVKQRISKGQITNDDTGRDDPYNTYMYEGLPPGPICSPGKDSIEAALYPDADYKDYMYFAAKGDGTHVFSKSFTEHQNVVAAIKKNSK